MTQLGPFVAVVGPGEDVAPHELAWAEEVGAAVAAAGAILVTGGLGGVMEAACRGARSQLGMAIGFLPGDDRADANGWVSLALPTGLGEMRNGLVVRCADALVAIGDSSGTRSEVALARKAGKPVIALGGPALGDVVVAGSPEGAVTEALRRIGTPA